ncbi:MAG: prepilin-type N-terminal cleavage/methylation domain-containing protein [Pseudomonadota bacterium]
MGYNPVPLKKSFHGFSISEMLVSLLTISVVATAAYKVLQANVTIQTDELRGQTLHKNTISAFAQIQSDFQQIDPSWGSRGVSSVFPAPLLGPDGNPGAGSAIVDLASLQEANFPTIPPPTF